MLGTGLRAALQQIPWIVVVACSLVLAAPGLAEARDYNYFCGYLPPNTWCMAAETHTYGLNEASLPPERDRNKWMCAKLIKPGSVPEYQYVRVCDYGVLMWVTSHQWGRAPYPNNSVSMKALVANGDNPDSHRIYGRGEY